MRRYRDQFKWSDATPDTISAISAISAAPPDAISHTISGISAICDTDALADALADAIADALADAIALALALAKCVLQR